MLTTTVRDWLLGLQDRIIAAIESVDGGRFGTDPWIKPAGVALQGDGLTRVLEGGAVIERGGCSFSHVRGPMLPPSATQHRPELSGAPFEAMGVSLVFHPRNPYAPTVHMNVRMIAALPAGLEPVVWFGGGMDLTPYYGFEEDAAHFHRVNRDALAPFGADRYPRYKQWCDEYFFLKHRNEPRGIGGVFFDDMAELGFAGGFEMIRAVGDAFVPAYLPILQQRCTTSYGERERDFQCMRRGRYVEFNLVLDRGTHFGLQSGGRTESILMSMPPLVTWRYDWQAEPGTPEARLASDFLRPRDWADWGAGLSAAEIRRIGLFGGTFDPVQIAHVELAHAALAQLALDELRWVPAGQPWQKPQTLTPAEHRVAMVDSAIANEPRFLLDRCEIERQGPSYTLDTVRELQAASPGAQVFLVIGQDQYARLHTWRGFEELLARVTLAVANRPDAPLDADARVRRAERNSVALPMLPISSTAVRDAVAEGRAIDRLVPVSVARYIEEHRLYRGSRS